MCIRESLNGGAVTIPDGTISKDATEVTVNMLVKIPKNIKSTWMWCLGTSRNRYIYLTGCANQDSHMRGGLCYDSNDKNEGWNYESVIGGSQALTEKMCIRDSIHTSYNLNHICQLIFRHFF